MKYTLLLFMLLFSSASFSQVEDIDSIVLNLIENRAPWAGKIVNKKYYRLPELKKKEALFTQTVIPRVYQITIDGESTLYLHLYLERSSKNHSRSNVIEYKDLKGLVEALYTIIDQSKSVMTTGEATSLGESYCTPRNCEIGYEIKKYIYNKKGSTDVAKRWYLSIDTTSLTSSTIYYKDYEGLLSLFETALKFMESLR